MTVDLRVSPEVLGETDDGELAWRVIERAYHAVSAHDGPAALDAGLAQLTPGQRALLALHWTVAEVSNGGFDQFFTNPSGLLVDEALAGFDRIGAPEAAAVLRQAVAVFASRPAPGDPENPAFGGTDDTDDDDEATVAFDAYRARHEPLEEQFYVLMDTELYPRAAAYVRAHRDDFFLAPQALPRLALPP